MTNHWVDIKNADLVIVMGGNAAEAHPVGFRWAIEAKKQNGAKLMVVNPGLTVLQLSLIFICLFVQVRILRSYLG